MTPKGVPPPGDCRPEFRRKTVIDGWYWIRIEDSLKYRESQRKNHGRSS